MATSPRPGIINLDFVDATQIGKNIHDTDPWGNLIAGGIDVLGDRERGILYRRALAQAQGLEAPDETSVGDLVTGAGKKIGEGASWLKDKWDRLDIRSPFEEKLSESTKTETPITETPSERGSREMIGYAPNQSPIETDKYRTNLKAPEMADVEPNDEVSFGFNQDVGQGEEKASPIIPLATGEQTPEQIGVKVDFGTSEPKTDYTNLRSPFAMRAKSEGSEAVSPVAGAEVPAEQLKAPDRAKSQMEAWSEMYRLKPEQAKFDYERTQNEAVLAQKGEIAQARMELMQSKMEAKANTASSLDELQQLWKENQRGLLQARKDQDKTSTEMYQANIDRLLPILQEKAPSVWGTPAVKKDVVKIPPPGGDDQTTVKEPTAKEKAVAEGYTAVKKFVVDNDNDGVIDDVVALEQALTAIRDKYGVSDADLTDVRNAVTVANTSLEKKSDKKIAAGERARSAASQAFSQHKDFLPSVQTVKAIQADPTNQTNIQLGVSELLKILSGTGVSDSERMNTVLSLTPTDYQNEVRSKATQLGKAFIDKFLKMDNVMLAEYATHVNPQLIASELKKRIPSDSWKWAENHSLGGGSGAGGGGASGKFSKYGKGKK